MAALVVLLATLIPAFSQIPFEVEGRWGYKSAAGQVLIPPRYTVAERFSRHGIAAVCDDDGWAYIDKSGRVVIRPFLFDNAPDEFSQGLARFTRNGKFGFFNRAGKIVIPARFDFAEPFRNGRARVCTGCRRVQQGEHWTMEGGRWSFIDSRGEPLAPAKR